MKNLLVILLLSVGALSAYASTDEDMCGLCVPEHMKAASGELVVGQSTVNGNSKKDAKQFALWDAAEKCKSGKAKQAGQFSIDYYDNGSPAGVRCSGLGTRCYKEEKIVKMVTSAAAYFRCL